MYIDRFPNEVSLDKPSSTTGSLTEWSYAKLFRSKNRKIESIKNSFWFFKTEHSEALWCHLLPLLSWCKMGKYFHRLFKTNFWIFGIIKTKQEILQKNIQIYRLIYSKWRSAYFRVQLGSDTEQCSTYDLQYWRTWN